MGYYKKMSMGEFGTYVDYEENQDNVISYVDYDAHWKYIEKTQKNRFIESGKDTCLLKVSQKTITGFNKKGGVGYERRDPLFTFKNKHFVQINTDRAYDYMSIDIDDDRFDTVYDFICFCRDEDFPVPTLAIQTPRGGIHAHWLLDKPIFRWDRKETVKFHKIKFIFNIYFNGDFSYSCNHTRNPYKYHHYYNEVSYNLKEFDFVNDAEWQEGYIGCELEIPKHEYMPKFNLKDDWAKVGVGERFTHLWEHGRRYAKTVYTSESFYELLNTELHRCNNEMNFPMMRADIKSLVRYIYDWYCDVYSADVKKKYFEVTPEGNRALAKKKADKAKSSIEYTFNNLGFKGVLAKSIRNLAILCKVSVNTLLKYRDELLKKLIMLHNETVESVTSFFLKGLNATKRVINEGISRKFINELSGLSGFRTGVG